MRGYSTYHLPHGYYSARYYGSPYYYHGGSWYRPYGPRYVVVAPPIGIGISVLPPYYSTVWFGGSPYYYADDTYYTYRPERREYVVTEPPRGEVRVEPAQAAAMRSSSIRRTGRARSSRPPTAMSAIDGQWTAPASTPRGLRATWRKRT